MSRAELHGYAERYFKYAGTTEPDVALVNVDGERLVFKDYGRAKGWFARLIAPILVAREASALEALAGLDGVPRLLRRLDRRGVLMTFCPARPWPAVLPADVAYGRVADLLVEIHARGVAHGDLRGGGNFLVSDDGKPFVVDFVARVRQGATWNMAWNWLFRQFVKADQSALAKLKVKHAPHLASAADHALLTHQSRLERMARWLGQTVRRGTRFLAARR